MAMAGLVAVADLPERDPERVLVPRGAARSFLGVVAA
jgi:hypothetical protein